MSASKIILMVAVGIVLTIVFIGMLSGGDTSSKPEDAVEAEKVSAAFETEYREQLVEQFGLTSDALKSYGQKFTEVSTDPAAVQSDEFLGFLDDSTAKVRSITKTIESMDVPAVYEKNHAELVQGYKELLYAFTYIQAAVREQNIQAINKGAAKLNAANEKILSIASRI